MAYDFLAVGDITTDAFIKLKDAHVTCKIDKKECELCMRFGDKLPYESVTEVRAVGNAPNAAVSAHRLGLSSTIVTDIGDDRTGEDCMATLAQEGMSREFISLHPGAHTNYHYVLQYEEERTILIKQEQYPYRLPNFSTPPKWFYLSSVAENSLSYQLELASYAAANKVKLAFQPGTFQMKAGIDALAAVYRTTEIFFCNKEEAQRILKTEEGDVKKLLGSIRKLGPRIAVITDARNGAQASDGTHNYFIPMYPDPAPPKNRTGAGDAFASTVTAFLALGLSLEEALIRGPINSASVVQHIGAQAGLLSKDELEAWYAKRPADFKITLV